MFQKSKDDTVPGIGLESDKAQGSYGNSLPAFLASIEVGALFAIAQVVAYCIQRSRRSSKAHIDTRNNQPTFHPPGFYRLLRVFARMFSGTCTYTLGVLIPLNYAKHESVPGVTGMDVLSCLNIPRSAPQRFWGHFSIAFCFILYTYYVLWDEVDKFVTHHVQNGSNQGKWTFIVTGMPNSDYNTLVRQELYRYLSQETKYTEIVDDGFLDFKENRLGDVIDNIEKLSLKALRSGTLELADLDSPVEQLARRLNRSRPRGLCHHAGIVELFSLRDVMIVRNLDLAPLELHQTDNKLADVLWADVFRPISIRRLQIWAVYGLTMVLIVVLALPVSLTGFFSQITYVAQVIPGFEWVLKTSPWLISYLQGALPQLTLLVIVTMTPTLLRYLSRIHGHITSTEADVSFQNYFFLYLYLQVFLFVSFSSNLGSILFTALSQPTQIPRLLAMNLPKTGNYFLSYTTLQGLTLSAAAIIEWTTIIKHHVMSWIRITTPRMLLLQSNTKSPDWAVLFPTFTIVGVIGKWLANCYPTGSDTRFSTACVGIIFSISTPIISVCNTTVFLVLLMVYKRKFEYERHEVKNLSDDYFLNAIHHVFVGLYTMELCLIGIFVGVKNTRNQVACLPQAALTTAMLVMTVAFHIWLFRSSKHKMDSPLLMRLNSANPPSQSRPLLKDCQKLTRLPQILYRVLQVRLWSKGTKSSDRRFWAPSKRSYPFATDEPPRLELNLRTLDTTASAHEELTTSVLNASSIRFRTRVVGCVPEILRDHGDNRIMLQPSMQIWIPKYRTGTTTSELIKTRITDLLNRNLKSYTRAEAPGVSDEYANLRADGSIEIEEVLLEDVYT